MGFWGGGLGSQQVVQGVGTKSKFCFWNKKIMETDIRIEMGLFRVLTPVNLISHQCVANLVNSLLLTSLYFDWFLSAYYRRLDESDTKNSLSRIYNRSHRVCYVAGC